MTGKSKPVICTSHKQPPDTYYRPHADKAHKPPTYRHKSITSTPNTQTPVNSHNMAKILSSFRTIAPKTPYKAQPKPRPSSSSL